MGRRRHYKPVDMRPEMMEHRAKKYVNDYKGWQCPSCYAFVPAGEDTCFACGYEAMYDSAPSGDDDTLSVMGWFIFFFLAPLNYIMVSSGEFSLLEWIFVPPVVIMLISCIVGLRYIWTSNHGNLKWIIRLDWYSLFVRGWVLYYTVRTAWIVFPITYRLFF